MQTLDWFIKEQGEEEKNAADLITKMELFGGDSKGLYMLCLLYTSPYGGHDGDTYHVQRAKALPSAFKPVSYTHLDVYKRQALIRYA